MKHGLIALLAVALAGAAGESSGEERSPGHDSLEGKRRQAPIRGRRFSPERAERLRQREDAAEWRRHREREEGDRHDRRGDKDDADDE